MGLDAKYRAFVAEQPGATLWHDADFLEATHPLNESAAWCYAHAEVDGKLAGVLPYYKKRRLDGWVVTMPVLLRYCGPLVSENLSKTLQSQVITQLFETVNNTCVAFDQLWPEELNDVSFSKNARWKCKNRLTYFADTSGEPAEILKRANNSMRRRLRRAGEFFSQERGDLSKDDLAMYRLPFEKQKSKVPYVEAVLERIFSLLFERKQAICQRVFSPDNQLAASAICFMDHQRMYLWVIGSRDDLGNPNAGSYAYYQMLLYANELGIKEVDFLGSMLPGPAENRRQLGAKPREYAYVFRDNTPIAKLIRACR